MIINGELPGRFVWKDDVCVAFLTINPLTPGHTLVVPRQEVDHWTDLDAAVWARVAEVSHLLGEAIKTGFGNTRAGMIIAGFEVPHAHVHVFGADHMAHLDFGQVDPAPEPAALDAAAERIRTALRASGHGEFVADA